MNNETKIKLIQKSIEDKTGYKVEVSQDFGTIIFTKLNDKGGYAGMYEIGESILNLLPISDPLEEQPQRLMVLKELRSMAHICSDMSTRCMLYHHIEREIEKLEPPQAPVKQG